MKQILVELDDRCARDLEQVAPVKKRMRAEFIRLAIRRAIDLAIDRSTRDAYRAAPLNGELLPSDLAGWDDNNQVAAAARSKRKRRAA